EAGVADNVPPVMPMRFDTKIAVVLENELALWQKVNVTAFLLSGFAAADPSLVGAPYVDASSNEYLPMLRQPILVYASNAAGVRRAYERTLARASSTLSASPPAARERRSTRSSTGPVHSPS